MAYIPYGYKIQDGVVTVDEKAAGQVRYSLRNTYQDYPLQWLANRQVLKRHIL